MNSKDSMGITGTNVALMSTRMLEMATQRGVEVGVKAAVDYINNEKQQQRQGRYDRRLRNTRLLLRNYRSFKVHAMDAVFSAKQLKESAVDILDDLDDTPYDNDLYVESIKRSQQRTAVIIRHIDEMLKYYRIYCERSRRPEDMRKYRVIMAYYIDDEEITAQQIGALHSVDSRTVYKDISMAIKPISSLIFGIDGLKTGQ